MSSGRAAPAAADASVGYPGQRHPPSSARPPRLRQGRRPSLPQVTGAAESVRTAGLGKSGDLAVISAPHQPQYT